MSPSIYVYLEDIMCVDLLTQHYHAAFTAALCSTTATVRVETAVSQTNFSHELMTSNQSQTRKFVSSSICSNTWDIQGCFIHGKQDQNGVGAFGGEIHIIGSCP